MKIYQIHEYGGEWEDSYDYIVGSYLLKEKAIDEKERLEKEEEYLRALIYKCRRCPLRHYIKSNINIEQYCNEYEPFDINKHDSEEYDENDKCVNYYYHHESSWYKIEEVNVIE